MEVIRQRWSETNFEYNFEQPKILIAFNKSNERFLVINDHGSVYRLMNQQGQVFMVAHFRCAKEPNNQYYICDDPFHIVSCTKYDLTEDQYAYDVIRPLVFGKQ